MVSGGTFLLEGVFFGVCRLPVVRPFCSALSFDRPLELQVFQLGIGRMSGLHLRMGDLQDVNPEILSFDQVDDWNNYFVDHY